MYYLLKSYYLRLEIVIRLYHLKQFSLFKERLGYINRDLKSKGTSKQFLIK